MTALDISLLVGGGLLAGVVNTLAGGGSLLTVPLLVLVGLPAGVANGTNRVGVLLQNATAAWRFRAEGVSGLRASLPVLPPVVLGAIVGAALVTQLSDAAFGRAFGVMMLVLLVPTLRGGEHRAAAPSARAGSPALRWLLFFALGVYGGAFQAGIGLLLVLGQAWLGQDLVRASSIKVVVILALTAAALPVFLWQGQVAWPPALLLGAGFAGGGELGARLAVRGGERLIRPVLALAVVALAARMLGLF